MSDSSFDLRAIGATADIFAQFQQNEDRGMIPGRVSVVHRDQYRIYTAAGELSAEVVGALLYRTEDPSDLPVVGDWVVCRLAGDFAMIHDVLPRRTKFSRRAAGNREQEQTLAANIDLAMIVCGLDHDFSLRRIERYVTLTRESGAEAAVVLNKADLCDDVAACRSAVEQIAKDAKVLAISARSSEDAERVRSLIAYGQTVALLGSSGVGKSTLVNQLLGQDRQRTREVRVEDSRGRHTTTHRELIPLPGGGALIDTPGMRELQLWAATDSLDETFDDIVELAVGCRFRDCSHQAEAGCAVQAAIANGALDPARWESYRKMRAEIAWHLRRTDVHAALAEKRRWKQIHKAMRGFTRD